MEEVDDLGDGIFVRLLQVVSWVLVVLFSIPAASLAAYQIMTLYMPYSLARLSGSTDYRFPEYMYTVWGDDLTDLTIEHWGYLACCVGVTAFAALYVIPETPWRSKSSPRINLSWVLKDVAHAKEEVAFYERVREQILTAKSREAKRLARFLDVFFCVCPGVVQLPEETLEDASARMKDRLVHAQLVFPKLSSGSASSQAKSFRFADLKLGKQTAVAGWMGKSAFRAWKNHQIDRVTNSAAESFRVEGIDNPPGLLESCYFSVANSKTFRDPKTWSLLFSKVPSISISSGGNHASSSGADSASSSKKKIDRITLQRLNGVRFWRLMLDFSEATATSFQKRTTFTKRNELYARFLLLSVLVKLTKLVNGLCQIEWPQMWVGSSVGIGFDLANVVGGAGEVGETDAGAAVRGAGEQQQRRADPVMQAKDQLAVLSLLYHSARTFLHRFTSPVWRSVVLVVQEFRSMHDPVAKAGAELPLFPAHVDVAAYYGLGEKNMESMKESLSCTKEKGPEVVETSETRSPSIETSTFGYVTVRFHVLTESRVSLELTDFYLNPHSPGAKQARNLNVCVLAFEDTRDGFVHLSEEEIDRLQSVAPSGGALRTTTRRYWFRCQMSQLLEMKL
eukprot:g5129.t1